MAKVSLETLIEKSEKAMGNGMEPYVKNLAIELIKLAYKEKIYIQISAGHRTMEKQASLYGQGRSSFVYKGKDYGDKSKSVVTNAKPGYSNHNYGLAIDYFLVSEDGKTSIWTVNDKWRRVAAIAKSLKFKWGGDWTSFKDYPHLEMTDGLTTTQLRAGRKPNFPNVKLKPAATKEAKDVPKVKPAVKIAVSSKPIVPYPGLLKKGSEGINVQRVQRAAGMKEKDVSGVYDTATVKAVTAYQERKGIGADGKVGPITWNMMF